MCPGAGRGCRGGLPAPLGVLGVQRGGHAQDSAFAPGSSEMSVDFFCDFFLSLVYICADCTECF